MGECVLCTLCTQGSELYQSPVAAGGEGIHDSFRRDGSDRVGGRVRDRQLSAQAREKRRI